MGERQQRHGLLAQCGFADHPFDPYFAVGNQGTVLQKHGSEYLDQIWEPSPRKSGIYGSGGNHQSTGVLAGLEGAIVQDILQPLLDPVSFVNFSRASAQNVYLISGNVDQRVTVQSATNLTNWVDGVTFELIDPSGTLLILEPTDTNNPPVGFLRGKMAP